MTPDQQRERNKRIARRVVFGVMCVYLLTLDPFGLALLFFIWKVALAPDPRVPLPNPVCHGTVRFDPRVHLAPDEAPPLHKTEHQRRDIEF